MLHGLCPPGQRRVLVAHAFVAGGAELANAEVEPSLLSLICRELNNARLAQGKDTISIDVLAGSNATILGEFDTLVGTLAAPAWLYCPPRRSMPAAWLALCGSPWPLRC